MCSMCTSLHVAFASYYYTLGDAHYSLMPPCVPYVYLHVYHMVVTVVADLDVLQPELGEDLLPGLPVDEGGGVHGAPVRDDEHVLQSRAHQARSQMRSDFQMEKV